MKRESKFFFWGMIAGSGSAVLIFTGHEWQGCTLAIVIGVATGWFA